MKTLLALLLTASLHADAYIDYINSVAQEQYNYSDSIINGGLDISAGNMAVSAIDFNPDHKGYSLGLGFGTGNTWNSYRAYAGALGGQYAWSYRETDVAVTVKSWIGKHRAYGVGFGGVVGF